MGHEEPPLAIGKRQVRLLLKPLVEIVQSFGGPVAVGGRRSVGHRCRQFPEDLGHLLIVGHETPRYSIAVFGSFILPEWMASYFSVSLLAFQASSIAFR